MDLVLNPSHLLDLEFPMMSKCANPCCSSAFRYLREGKLFQVPAGMSYAAQGELKKTPSRDEFFWLCGACSKEFTIVADAVEGVRTVPRTPRAMQAAG